MTGFGAAEGAVGAAQVSVEVRSVNHRFFNPTIKLPSQFARWEGEVREALRRGVSRGHVTVMARVDQGAGDGGSRVDETRFAAYLQKVRELQQRHGLGGEIDVGAILRLPDVITTDAPSETGTAAELVTIVERAVAALDAMRLAEGERLRSYLEERLGVMEAAMRRVGERAPDRLIEQRDRLRDAVRELTEGLAVDEQRLAQEIAILADRLDVSEEISRFRAHLQAFRAALNGPPGDGVGKRLGFLVQELLREANTTGSKGNDPAIVREVLSIKEELERIREQVENLE